MEQTQGSVCDIPVPSGPVDMAATSNRLQSLPPSRDPETRAFDCLRSVKTKEFEKNSPSVRRSRREQGYKGSSSGYIG